MRNLLKIMYLCAQLLGFATVFSKDSMGQSFPMELQEQVKHLLW